jgi:hypothetical protein
MTCDDLDGALILALLAPACAALAACGWWSALVTLTAVGWGGVCAAAYLTLAARRGQP